MTASTRAAPVAPPRHRSSRTGTGAGSRPATGCCCPGALWLVVFFVIPFYSLVATSLYDPSGSVLQGYEMT